MRGRFVLGAASTGGCSSNGVKGAPNSQKPLVGFRFKIPSVQATAHAICKFGDARGTNANDEAVGRRRPVASAT